MNKSPRGYARPLAAFVGATLADTFKRRGFAATEIVTHWEDIVGADIAAHCEPMKIDWPHRRERDPSATATIVLRVEGPAAIEIQHQAAVIIARINQFFGWPAIGRVALRQGPLRRRARRARPTLPASAVDAEARRLTGIVDEDLRTSLARLGAAVKQG
ncbi:MAG: DciA family protein [Xanthobacteraceae bacterium]